MPSPTNSRKVIALSNPKSPISESYVRLRTNIEMSEVDEPIQIISVTSAGPEEGKSTTTANLSVVFASSDKKVLLIDADLRKPTMHHYFMLSNRVGLTNVLTQQVSLLEAAQSTNLPNLHVITAGPIPPNPSELLASKRMGTLLAELRKEYDIILIDTPPTLAVADSQIIASRCDGVVLVIKSGGVKRDAAMKAKVSLEHAKARILGVVLNGVSRKSAEDYYYYYYGESTV